MNALQIVAQAHKLGMTTEVNLPTIRVVVDAGPDGWDCVIEQDNTGEWSWVAVSDDFQTDSNPLDCAGDLVGILAA